MMSLLTILNVIPSSFLKKYEGSEMLVEKRLQKNKFLDELARDSVIEETRVRFKVETFYNLLDTFSNQLKESFKDITTVVQKFKVLDQKFVVQKTFNKCEEALSEMSDVYELNTVKADLLFEFKSFCQLCKQNDAARCCHFRSS